MDQDHEAATDAGADSYAALLDQCWVILLWDPDGNDTSPWPVTARSKDEAIQKAVADWHRWLVDASNDLMPHSSPDVFKVYRNSWIGERVSHPT